MNCTAFCRLAIALVSVISKQTCFGAMPYNGCKSRRKSMNVESPMVEPERLMAHISIGSKLSSARREASPSKALRTTQRSICGISPKRSAAGMNCPGATSWSFSSCRRSSNSTCMPSLPDGSSG
ncbi:hypothetical protein D3C81_1550530 [compost metagenome]